MAVWPFLDGVVFFSYDRPLVELYFFGFDQIPRRLLYIITKYPQVKDASRRLCLLQIFCVLVDSSSSLTTHEDAKRRVNAFPFAAVYRLKR